LSQYIIPSPAKINLFLKVISRYANNFHEIESVMSFIDLYDYMKINITKCSTNSSIKINTISDLDISNINSDNILYNIHQYFACNYSIKYNFKIDLYKNIPLGSGLGGASSNAALFMKFLNKICNLKISNSQLQKISFNFGSDIAFFINNNSSIIRECGIISTNYNNSSRQNILLIYPNINISTAKIFSLIDNEFSSKTSDNSINNCNQLELVKNFKNDLENIVLENYPEIHEFRQYFLELNPAILKMSGSGSSFFAIFNNDKLLNNALIEISGKYPDFFVKKCQILQQYDQKI
jgi:4-diphosphocytidyl-2-C-methyl-D-erythritol kinase